MITRCYSDLIKLETFEDRFRYLQLGGSLGKETFGIDRYLNQEFYRDYHWRRVRDEVIRRDNACDLGVKGYEIGWHLIVHHMNPIVIDDIIQHSETILDPEFLICVSPKTHNAIHYGGKPPIVDFIVRTKNDTCPWR